DPLVEYKREAFEMFTELMGTIKAGIVRAAFTTTTNVEAYFAMRERMARRVQTVHRDLGDLTAAAQPKPAPAPQPATPSASFTVTVPGFAKPAPEARPQEPQPHGDGSLETLMESLNAKAEPIAPVKAATPKVGRNEPCPCGSGKKYKNCCGR
ncbi:MAG: SEC-C domain-containing protein, partial [Kiritimatiellae bacterium]|nr:SEC-C domain-containing protein [Kiritimatiellia bacterium]